MVSTIIGDGSEIKAAAVVDALTFHSYADDADWSEFSTGVVCFVKDNNKKSHYIRLVDLGEQKSLKFEQEIYNHFIYKQYTPTLYSFAGNDFLVEMSFADADEALLFSQHVEFKKKTRRNAVRKSSSIASAPKDTDFAVKSKQTSKWKSVAGKTTIAKSQHLAQVGIDPNTGDFDASKISPNWKQLLDTVGVTQEQLKDKRTANFIYNFVEKRGGIEEANRQLEESRKRSVLAALSPGSQATSSRWVSCASLARNKGKASSTPPASNGPAPPPNPPPPPSLQAGGRIPPPPPPPLFTPFSNAANGKAHVTHSTVLDAHSDLLSSIRAGIQLKSVEDREGPAAPEEELDGLAGALSRALASRNAVMQQSDDEDDPGDEWSD
ncbi:hypothetical protein EMCRGX_G022331 [Ephydatia muelleri]